MKIDIQSIIKKLELSWQGSPCPMCGSKNFNLQDRVFQLVEFHEGSALSVGGPVLPVVPIICMKCGNTILINAVISGAMEKQKREAVNHEPK